MTKELLAILLPAIVTLLGGGGLLGLYVNRRTRAADDALKEAQAILAAAQAHQSDAQTEQIEAAVDGERVKTQTGRFDLLERVLTALEQARGDRLRLQQQLDASNGQYAELSSKFNRIEQELLLTRDELRGVKEDLRRTKRELTLAKAELAQTRMELTVAHQERETAISNLAIASARIDELERRLAGTQP